MGRAVSGIERRFGRAGWLLLLAGVTGCSQGGVSTAAEPPLPAGLQTVVSHFDAAKPSREIWVNAGTRVSGNGSAQAPLRTIGEAIAQAGPCVAIMVKAGIYQENVRLPRTLNGSPTCPIWLISADGIGMASIAAPDPTKAAILGGGNENIVVEGFRINGGRNGIQFSQNGFTWDDMVRNIVIRYNIIDAPLMDGIKVNGAERVLVAHNSISRGTEEGIDFVGVVGGAMIRNSISRFVTTSAGIFAKGGSHSILVAGNSISDISANGISIGGWVNPSMVYRAGYNKAEASAMAVIGNRVENVGKSPLIVMAGKDSGAKDNLFVGNPLAPVFLISGNHPKALLPLVSENVAITDNIVRGGRKPVVKPGSANIVMERNRDGSWAQATGPDNAGFRLPGR